MAENQLALWRNGCDRRLGAGGYANNPGGYANNTGSQNPGVQVGALFNSQTGAYRMPTPTVPPAPAEVQAVTMAAEAAVGGPPAPPLPGALGNTVRPGSRL